MLTNETAPQQAEHFEWLNAVNFYHSYLDIINDRLEALTMIAPGQTDGEKVGLLSERLNELKFSLNELAERISSHMEEVDGVAVSENRLELDLQLIHHGWLRDRFDEFESSLNEFRTVFNEFYVKTL